MLVFVQFQDEDDEEKFIKLPLYQPISLKEKNLEDYVTPRTIRFVTKLRLNTIFLNKDTKKWSKVVGFQSAPAILKSLKTVNDKTNLWSCSCAVL